MRMYSPFANGGRDFCALERVSTSCGRFESRAKCFAKRKGTSEDVEVYVRRSRWDNAEGLTA